MNRSTRYLLGLSACALASAPAVANEELARLSKDANQWVMPLGN